MREERERENERREKGEDKNLSVKVNLTYFPSFHQSNENHFLLICFTSCLICIPSFSLLLIFSFSFFFFLLFYFFASINAKVKEMQITCQMYHVLTATILPSIHFLLTCFTFLFSFLFLSLSLSLCSFPALCPFFLLFLSFSPSLSLSPFLSRFVNRKMVICNGYRNHILGHWEGNQIREGREGEDSEEGERKEGEK